MRTLLFVLFAFLISSSGAHTSHAESSFESTAVPRIIFGRVVSSKQSAIVQVRTKDGSDSSLCTGTLITPVMVLTAWHCVTKRAGDMTVIAGGKRFRVKRVITHPQVRVDDETGLVYNDVALLRLTQKAPQTPLPLVLSRSVAISEPLTILGYGLTEFGSAGVLRQGATQVDEVNSEFIVTLFSRSESNSCSGDSGGPALYSFVGSDGRAKQGIVGTTSTGTNSTCNYGDQTSYINLQSPIVSSFILISAPRIKTI